MKWLVPLVLVASASACHAAAPTPMASSPETSPSTAPVPSMTAKGPAPGAPTTHDLGPLGDGAITVRTGDRLTWSYRLHASVGFGASQSVSNTGVVRLLDSRTVYEQPERMKGPITGADAATGTFVFEAVAPGEAVLELRNEFRGDVEKRVRVTVTVR